MGPALDTITIIIAVYGAVLATLGFVLSIVLGINELRKERPKIKVKSFFGSLIDSDGKSSETLILFEAHNTSLVPIIITACGWLGEKGMKYQFIKPYLLELPKQLKSRRKVTAYYACRWFRDYKDKYKVIGFYFADEEGNIWKVKVSKKQKQLWESVNNNGYLIEWDKDMHSYFRVNKS